MIALFEQRTEDAIAQTDRKRGASCRAMIRSLNLDEQFDGRTANFSRFQ